MITIEYIAGFFDADGSVSLAKAGGKKRQNMRSPTLSFANIDRALLEEIKTFFGGGGSIYTKKAKKHEHTDTYELKMRTHQTVEALRQMYPHLLHAKKRYRAQLIINEYYSVTVNRGGRYTEERRAVKLDFERRFFEFKYK